MMKAVIKEDFPTSQGKLGSHAWNFVSCPEILFIKFICFTSIAFKSKSNHQQYYGIFARLSSSNRLHIYMFSHTLDQIFIFNLHTLYITFVCYIRSCIQMFTCILRALSNCILRALRTQNKLPFLAQWKTTNPFLHTEFKSLPEVSEPQSHQI